MCRSLVALEEEFNPSTAPTDVEEHGETHSISRELDDKEPLRYPSPISIYSKPLALHFVNFHNFYKDMDYGNGTRKLAGGILITELLRHYFPNPKFTFGQLKDRTKSLIQTVPEWNNGTLWWAVTTTEEGDEMEDVVMDNNDPMCGIVRADSTVLSQRTSLVLLVAIATQSSFLNRRERTIPSSLQFADVISKQSGALVIDGMEFRHGNVMILGGLKMPFRPRLEFYNFDVDSHNGASLVPWFGQVESAPTGLGTNSFSLDKAEVRKVDHMFQAIAGISSTNKALNPDDSAISQVAQNIKHEVLAKREALKLLAQGSVLVESEEITDEWLRTLKLNKNGKLQGKMGHFLPKEQVSVVMRVAKERGITFVTFAAQPSQRAVKRRLAKEKRLSVKMETKGPQ